MKAVVPLANMPSMAYICTGIMHACICAGASLLFVFSFILVLYCRPCLDQGGSAKQEKKKMNLIQEGHTLAKIFMPLCCSYVNFTPSCLMETKAVQQQMQLLSLDFCSQFSPRSSKGSMKPRLV